MNERGVRDMTESRIIELTPEQARRLDRLMELLQAKDFGEFLAIAAGKLIVMDAWKKSSTVSRSTLDLSFLFPPRE